jgi:hypothetical protein
MTPRTVVVPGAGGNSLSFEIPPGVEFDVESVLADVDTSAAGATFGELSIADQSGVVIATKRQGLPIPGGSSGTETWALGLNDEEAAAAAATAPFCAAGINGSYVVNNNALTNIGIDPGALQDSGQGVFGEDITAGGVTGVKINTAGTYLGYYSIQYTDNLGAALANPENFVAYGQDVCGSIFVGLDDLNSLYARGFTALITGDSRFELGWRALFTTHGATAAGDPIIFHTKQATGITLHAYTQVAVFQILPTALF